jgi:hypothetical protein
MVAAQQLKFIEFVDLILARLYERDKQEPGALFDLNEISAELNGNVPEAWVIDAAKVLQTRGLIMPLITFGGITAQLTGEGRVYVEEEKGTGIIKRYHHDPAPYIQVHVHGDNNQTVVGTTQGNVAQSQTTAIEKEREPAFKLLREIEDGVGKDKNLIDEERKQLRDDIDHIRQQLKRREPNRPVLAALLGPISQVTSVASQVVSLIRLLNL